MKKAAIAIMVVLTSFVSIVHSAQKSNTWYAGGKLGFSQFHDTGWHNKSLNSNDTTHESHLGVGISGGYQMNPFVAVELGYNWMGRIPYKGDIQNGEFKAQGIQLTSKFSYPITHDLDLYTRLGGMLWRTDFKKSTVGNHDTGISPVFAGGIEWAVTRNIATRLEYQWISNIGDMNTVNLRPDNSILSLGVSYRFNQNEKSLALISNQDSISSEEFTHDNNKNFTLKSDILFNFNKMTLKSEGLKALDQLYTQLVNSINSEEDSSIVVIGFTDRIGSDSYNQDLSEKRAQSVIDYLVYKGIPRNKIFLRGMGKSHSITGTSCDNVQVRSELINCLSPDRRVEIKIVNNRDILTQPTVE